MASPKPLFLLLALVALAAHTGTARAQTCNSQLSGLNVCAPFVVPGASQSQPSAECCGALQAVAPDCLCSTLRIASQLPTQCNLPAANCGN